MAKYPAQAEYVGVCMTTKRVSSDLVARRGELMAELFLEDFEPQLLARPTSDKLGYDLLAGFPNKEGGINTFAVQVKPTDRPPTQVALSRRSFDRLAKSNIPGLLLVPDVKQNRMYYAWLDFEAGGKGSTVAVPVTEANDETIATLRRQFQAASGRVAVAG